MSKRVNYTYLGRNLILRTKGSSIIWVLAPLFPNLLFLPTTYFPTKVIISQKNFVVQMDDCVLMY